MWPRGIPQNAGDGLNLHNLKRPLAEAKIGCPLEIVHSENLVSPSSCVSVDCSFVRCWCYFPSIHCAGQLFCLLSYCSSKIKLRFKLCYCLWANSFGRFQFRCYSSYYFLDSWFLPVLKILLVWLSSWFLMLFSFLLFLFWRLNWHQNHVSLNHRTNQSGFHNPSKLDEKIAWRFS